MEVFDAYSALLALGMPPCLPKPHDADTEAPSGWHWSKLSELSPDLAHRVLESHALEWFVNEFGFCSVVRMGGKICLQAIRSPGSLPKARVAQHGTRRRRLGEMLVERGLLLEEELERALNRHRETGKRLGEVLLLDNVIEPDALLPVLAEHFDVPYVTARVLRESATYQTASNFAEAVCRRFGIVCWGEKNEFLAVAMANPMDVIVLDTLQSLASKEIRPYLANPVAIADTIDRCFAGEARSQDTVSEDTEDFADEMELATSAPITKYVQATIREALRQNATAIRMVPVATDVLAEFCIDGKWQAVTAPPRRLLQAVAARFKVLCGWEGDQAPSTVGPEMLLDSTYVAMWLTIQKGPNGESFEVNLQRLAERQKPPARRMPRVVQSLAPVTVRADTLLDAIVEAARVIRGDTDEGTGIHAVLPA